MKILRRIALTLIAAFAISPAIAQADTPGYERGLSNSGAYVTNSCAVQADQPYRYQQNYYLLYGDGLCWNGVSYNLWVCDQVNTTGTWSNARCASSGRRNPGTEANVFNMTPLIGDGEFMYSRVFYRTCTVLTAHTWFGDVTGGTCSGARYDNP